MKPESILETILYSNNIEEAAWFYHEVLGFDMPREKSELAAMFRIDPNHVLLIFNPTISDRPGRDVPSHGARGPGHVAFRIQESDFQNWLDRFSKHGIPIEQEIEWDRTDPGKSIYVRDPSGNSVELITADIWK
ncbi:MAG: VOC family protein [Phycisphaerales bacterium]|jgi:catechol 2,3-dioxygenase-like lactoylglutathione lyase family enzyme|nr:VOC family protein [Phycisphaerales bacterium]